jgi:drug/metabolite transporter (DMT)-like permease
MSPTALTLVVAAAFCHAGWNLAAKRAGTSGPVLLWLSTVVTTVLYLPIVLLLRQQVTWLAVGLIVVSAVLHLGYFLLLQRGYAIGDLSVVYPLARGTGPLLSVAVAVLLLGERPGWLALAGAAAVIGGILIVSGGGLGSAKQHHRKSLAYGLATGTLIAAYTVFDAHAVGALAITPVLFDWGNNAARMLLLAPYAARNRDRVRQVWRVHRRETIVIGVLSPLAYVLVLFAYTMAPISLVAPARELSIVVGSLFGWLLLREPNPARRLLGAVVVLGGVVALAST